MQKILVTKTGVICPDCKPYSEMPNMRKATRDGPGQPVVYSRANKKATEDKSDGKKSK